MKANQRRVLAHVVERPAGAVFQTAKPCSFLFLANLFEDIIDFSDIIRINEAK